MCVEVADFSVDYKLDFSSMTFHQTIDLFYVHCVPVASEELEVVALLVPSPVELDSESEAVRLLALAMR